MWHKVKDFQGYLINESGQVMNNKTKKILSQSLSTSGYYQVNIAGKSRRVHRLLAITFIDNPHNLETINHINGNKLDNSLANLEWMSRSENVKHSRYVLGKKPIPYSVNIKEHHLKGKTGINSNKGIKIIAVLPDSTQLIFGSAYEAALELFNDSNKGKLIRQCISRKTYKYNNIKFKDYERNNKS